MLFLHKLITRTSETDFRNIANANFTNLVFDSKIEIHIQISDLKVSSEKEILIEIKKSLDNLWVAYHFCDPALTAEQFMQR